jgi:chlorite dismutase
MANETAPLKRGQFVRFCFFKMQPSWRQLSATQRETMREDFAAIVDRFGERMFVQPYSTVGTRADTDVLLVLATYRLEDFQELQTELLASSIGPHIAVPYSYLAMTRRSIYIGSHQHAGQDGARMVIKPGSAKYLFVYPFVKTRAWYALPLAERQRMMTAHIQLGHKFPSVRINTTYSFGLDDQEFVVSFDSDSPDDFLELVMAMRETEASSYTLRDTPIFTCITMDVRAALATV